MSTLYYKARIKTQKPMAKKTGPRLSTDLVWTDQHSQQQLLSALRHLTARTPWGQRCGVSFMSAQHEVASQVIRGFIWEADYQLACYNFLVTRFCATSFQFLPTRHYFGLRLGMPSVQGSEMFSSSGRMDTLFVSCFKDSYENRDLWEMVSFI